MKKGSGIGVRSNNHNSNSISPNSVRGVRAVLIRKDSPEDLLLRRLKEHLLYSKLRALLPSQSAAAAADTRIIQESSSPQGAMEYEPEPHEIPARDSDDENSSGGVPAESWQVDENGGGGGGDDDFEYAVLESNADEKSEKAFIPSIKIKKMDSTLLLISTIVLKSVALSSALFRLLEEEKLDIVCENQYRTETKVSHTIQVNLCSEDYDVGALELKLHAWARGRKT